MASDSGEVLVCRQRHVMRRYRGDVRVLAGVCAGVLLAASPAAAGTGGADGVTVTIPDVLFASYDCQSAPVQVNVAVSDLALWAVAVSAAPAGKSQLDAVAFTGRGPMVATGSLLMCPADSAGSWTASVTSRVLLTQSRFTVPFEVRRLATTTTLTRVRNTDTGLKVKGTVLAQNGLAGRAPLTVRGLRKNGWRTLGHTAARKNGEFRFVWPRSARSVAVIYPGDAVTVASDARATVG